MSLGRLFDGVTLRRDLGTPYEPQNELGSNMSLTQDILDALFPSVRNPSIISSPPPLQPYQAAVVDEAISNQTMISRGTVTSGVSTSTDPFRNPPAFRGSAARLEEQIRGLERVASGSISNIGPADREDSLRFGSGIDFQSVPGVGSITIDPSPNNRFLRDRVSSIGQWAATRAGSPFATIDETERIALRRTVREVVLSVLEELYPELIKCRAAPLPKAKSGPEDPSTQGSLF